MREILFYPGSYSPLHIGHLCLANYIIEQMRDRFDELWFSLTPSNPFKEDNLLLPDDFRRRWAENLLREHPKIRLSLDEWELSQPNYTLRTMQYLHEKYPDSHFTLLMGLDSLLWLHKWYHSDELTQTTDILVYPRPGYHLPEDFEMPARTRVIDDVPTYEVSSTDIRERLEEGKDLPYLLATSIDDPLYQELSELIRTSGHRTGAEG